MRIWLRIPVMAEFRDGLLALTQNKNKPHYEEEHWYWLAHARLLCAISCNWWNKHVTVSNRRLHPYGGNVTQVLFHRFLLYLSLIALVTGYAIYQDRIPNGGSVPHPCKSNYIWQGVGHQNVLGGGDRNPFGLAFAAAGYVSKNLI